VRVTEVVRNAEEVNNPAGWVLHLHNHLTGQHLRTAQNYVDRLDPPCGKTRFSNNVEELAELRIIAHSKGEVFIACTKGLVRNRVGEAIARPVWTLI
jgi:hypothetical protein